MLTKRATVATILAVCALLAVLYAWDKTRPVALVESLTDRLQCVSYSPFREAGQSPYDPSLTISPAQIDADLSLLAQRFRCVRIYSVNQGLQEVPRLAAENGLKVLLGIWIGPDREANESEIRRAIKVAKTYRSAIEGVIVGNEVLLRADQPLSMLRRYIDRVDSALPGVAVTYADVWEFWLQHRELEDEVDFVTVHILPYWEDRPIPIENAVGHVSYIYHHVAHELKGKPVMIGETGWPSRGRQRQGAEPGLVNQARFIREFAVRAELEKIRYNLIEAFDQPWKRTLEGTIGGAWGLYDRNDAQKFPFQGLVAEAPQWGYQSAVICAAIFTGLLLRRRSSGIREVLLLLAISFAAGNACLTVWREIWASNRTLTEWSVTGFYGVLLVLLILHLGSELSAWCANRKRPLAIPSINGLKHWILYNDRSHGRAEHLLAILRIAFLFGAAFMCLVLFFDPRYRNFPVALYLVPAVGFALWAWICERTGAEVEEIVLASVVTVFGVLITISEHLITPRDGDWVWAESLNPDALAWTLCCLLLSGSVLVPVAVELRARQSHRAQQEGHGRVIPVIQHKPGGTGQSGHEANEARTGEKSQ
ncbi:MAG: hypothetical protein ACRERU_14850 [Methylococcales bacterium]